MKDHDYYEFGKMISNNSVAGPYGGLGNGGCLGWIIVMLVVAIIVAVLTVADYSGDNAKSSQPAAAEQTQEVEAEADDRAAIVEGRKIQITNNYSFRVPKGSEKTEKRLGEGFSNEQAYLYEEPDGNFVYITSFVIEDEPSCFPDLAEYLIYQGDANAQVGYNTFEDTAMAKSVAEGSDEDGEKLYITAYWWPDGGETLCCVEVASYAENSEVADFVKGTIGSEEYHGAPAGVTEIFDQHVMEPDMDDVYWNWQQDYQEQYEPDPKYTPWG